MLDKNVIICSVLLSIALILAAFFIILPIINNDSNRKNAEISSQYEGIAADIINKKTAGYINYIDNCLSSNEFKTFVNNDDIEISLLELQNVSHFSAPVIEIDGKNYNLAAFNKLQNSMEIVSAHLLINIKNILINGVNYQTEIYSKNINDYIEWYYSYFTDIGKKIKNVIGFFTGEKSSEERYFDENFNRIMNRNAGINHVVKNDMSVIYSIIEELSDDYFNTLEHFTVNHKQNNSDTLTKEMFIDILTKDIVIYFENVFGALDNANYFFYQDYKVDNDAALGAAMTSIKIVSGFSFLGNLMFDYLTLQTQRALNDSILRQQLYDRMIENQNNKIEIIKNPFNYLYNRLKIGNVLFVDNYFAGLNAYQHYGVYIGNGKVVHFAPPEGQEISIINLPEVFGNSFIYETTLEKFLNGRALQIDNNIEYKFSEQEIIQRARSRIGEKGYNLALNNCEHFARWCVTGESVSYQVLNTPQKLNETALNFSDGLNTIKSFIELFN